MAACPGARQPSAGKGPSDEQLRHRGRSRAPGRAGRRARQGGDPAPGRSTSSGSGRVAVARYCAGMGLRWFAVTLRLAGQGLGGAVPAYLALAFVCLVLAVIGRRHPAAAQPHHLPGVPGGGRAAAGRQPRPGPSLAGSVAACSRRPRSAGCSRCWLRTAWGWRCQAGPDLGPGARLAVVGTVAVGWWPASCSAAWRGWAACWHLACRARRGCRSAPGWSSVRCWASSSAARSPAGSRPPRRQVGRVSPSGR
jgi:hypothetical protein